jgi:hypothetical protein
MHLAGGVLPHQASYAAKASVDLMAAPSLPILLVALRLLIDEDANLPLRGPVNGPWVTPNVCPCVVYTIQKTRERPNTGTTYPRMLKIYYLVSSMQYFKQDDWVF